MRSLDSRTLRLDRQCDEFQLQPADVEDLAAVRDSVAADARLRAALSDQQLPASARSELASALLSGKVGERACHVAAALAAEARDGRDLSALLDRAEVRARLQNGGDVDEVADELFRFARTLESDPDLYARLTDSRLDLSARRELVDMLLSARVGVQTLRLIKRAMVCQDKPLTKTLDGYVEMAAHLRNCVIARVSAARPLAPEQLLHIKKELVRIYGQAIDLREEIVPEILGGVRIHIGDEVIDGTIKNRLNQVRHLIG